MPADVTRPTTLPQARDQYLVHLRRLRRSPSTLYQAGLYLGGYLDFLAERELEPSLARLNPELVGEAQDWWRARCFGSRAGAAAEFGLVVRLKAFGRWLWRRGIYDHDPLDRVERPRLPRLHREPFSEAECRRLAWAATSGPNPLMERAMLLLGLDTGCRIGELSELATSDLDLQTGAVVFRHTKNGRPRRVIFRVSTRADGGPTLVAVSRWLMWRRAAPTVDHVFVNPRTGLPLGRRGAQRIWAALGEAADVPNCFPHRARHTHASELLAELPGAELHLRHRLGHISHDVLADYVHISDRSAQPVADVASLAVKWDL